MHLDNYCRKEDRLPLSITVSIRVRDAAQNEYTYRGEVIDASKCGMRIKVDRFFRRESVVFLTMHFPNRLREYDWLTDVYNAYAVVVHSKKFGPEDFEIGVRLMHDKIPAHTAPFIVEECASPEMDNSK
jgi:hypothetical protein